MQDKQISKNGSLSIDRLSFIVAALSAFIMLVSCANGEERAVRKEISQLSAELEANPTDTAAIWKLADCYCLHEMENEAVNLAVNMENAVISLTGSHVLGLYRHGLFAEEIYLRFGDRESAANSLEDARIFMSRQAWGELSEEESARLEECLEKVQYKLRTVYGWE